MKRKEGAMVLIGQLKKLSVVFFLMFCFLSAEAQFSFNYNGPDTLYVGNFCNTALDWGHPQTPTAMATTGILISFDIDSISGGHSVNAPVSAGESIFIRYRAENDLGQVGFFSFTLEIADSTGPVFDILSLPPNITLNCGQALPQFFPFVNDNCDPNGTNVTLTSGVDLPTSICGDDTTVVNRWLATDANNNTTIHNQFITIRGDDVAPQIMNVPNDTTFYCEQLDVTYTAWVADFLPNVSIDDSGCGESTLQTNIPNSNQLNGCTNNFLYFTATDSCGNTTSDTTIVYILDTLPAQFNPAPVDLILDCSVASVSDTINHWLFNNGYGMVIENCGEVTWRIDTIQAFGLNNCNGLGEYAFIVTDPCGNEDTSSASVILQDNQGPVINNAPENEISSCQMQDADLDNWLSNAGGASVSDFCSPADSIQLSYIVGNDILNKSEVLNYYSNIPNGCVDSLVVDGITYYQINKSLDVTFLWTDICGNSSADSAIFVSLNLTPPFYNNAVSSLDLGCVSIDDVRDTFHYWIQQVISSGFSDACSDALGYSVSDTSIILNQIINDLIFNCGSQYSLPISFLGLDACGNESDTLELSFNYSGNGGLQVLSPAQNDSTYCSDSPRNDVRDFIQLKGNATISDGCLGSGEWIYFTWDSLGVIKIGDFNSGPFPSPFITCNSPLEVTFFYSDMCDTISTSAQFVSIDTIPPFIVDFLDTLYVGCDSFDIPNIQVDDDCSMVSFSSTDSAIDISSNPIYCVEHDLVVKRTYVLFDECTNRREYEQIVIALDEQGPTFELPPDSLFDCAHSDTIVFGVPSNVMDLCGNDIDIQSRDSVANESCMDKYMRIWTFTDVCGNSSVGIQSIIIADTVGPVWTSNPKDTVLNCGGDYQEVFKNWVSAVQAEDDCGMTNIFYAEHGNYDINNPASYENFAIDIPDTLDCDSMVLFSLHLDFIAVDDCGNKSILDATFEIQDVMSPVVAQHNLADVVTANADSCGADISIDEPWLYDACMHGPKESIVFQDTFSLTSLMPGSQNLVVSPMLLRRFFDENSIGVSDIKVRFGLVNADGEDEFERLQIIADNIILGQTSLTDNQCGNSDTSFIIANSNFTHLLQNDTFAYDIVAMNNPTNPGAGSMNDICGNSRVAVEMKFDVISVDSALDYYYVFEETDTIYSSEIPTNIFLSPGYHDWTFWASDCAGNVLMDSGSVFVNDTLLPMVTCPQNIDTVLEIGMCSLDLVLPAPIYTDNCADTLSYEIMISGANTIGPISWSPSSNQIFNLSSGANLVTLIARDESNNKDTCTYSINVFDEENPTIDCRRDTLFLPLETSQNIILNLDDLNVSFNDNCGIARTQSNPEVVTCDDIGSTINIIYYAEDFSGNIDSCFSELIILPSTVLPSFSINQCITDTIFLFANPPNDSTFDYQWSGPNNFVSSDENPIVVSPNDDSKGLYEVTITNELGCFATGAVDVDFILQFEPQLSIGADTVCLGDSIMLSTSSQSTSVEFGWYQGTFPSGVLLSRTTQSNLNIAPSTGTYEYYVIVQDSMCASKPSNVVDAVVRDLPSAVATPKNISICLGETIDFSSTSSASSYMYQWTGPNNYLDSVQNPAPITNAQLFQRGTYYLQIFDGYCYSNVDSVIVEIKELPAQPVITGENVVCENNLASLQVNNLTNIDSFIWTNTTTNESRTTITNEILFNPFVSEDAGFWQVVVMRNGCPSIPSELHELSIEQPQDIEISLLNGVACEGQDMQFLVDTFDMASYSWKGNAFTSVVQNPILPAANGVYYVTITTAAGCVMVDSIEVMTRPTPKVESISNNGILCIDGDAEVCFDIEITAQPGPINYMWTGPNNFSSTDSALCLLNATVDDNGIYTLSIEQNGCASNPVATIVQLTDISIKPEIQGPDILCEGENLRLTTAEFIGFGSVYHWITPQGEIITSDSFLLIENITEENQGYYAVYLESNNCKTQTSDSLFFDVINPPRVDTIYGERQYCEGESISLSINKEAGVEYLWLGPNGESSTDSIFTINNVLKDIHEGVYVLQARRLPCDYYSYFVNVEITKPPLQPTFSLDRKEVCLDRNAIVEICADDLIQNENAFYTILIDGQKIGDSTQALCQSINLNDNNLTEGIHQVQLELFINGCSSGRTQTQTLSITEIPQNITAFAGDDFVLCNELVDMLNADLPAGHQGLWVFDDDIVVDDVTNPSSTFELENYDVPTSVIWQLNYGACLAYTSDTVVVEALTAVQANDDMVSIGIADSILVPVLSNDELRGNNVVLDILSAPEQGVVSITPQQNIKYVPESYETGSRTIIYRICNEACPDICDSAALEVTIGDLTDCEVPNIITPNGDRYNDFFVIQCFGNEAEYENNELRIFNEWGSEVFYAAPYKNDWQGTYKGSPLPDGTYYYVLKYGTNRAPKAGFLVIQR